MKKKFLKRTLIIIRIILIIYRIKRLTVYIVRINFSKINLTLYKIYSCMNLKILYKELINNSIKIMIILVCPIRVTLKNRYPNTKRIYSLVIKIRAAVVLIWKNIMKIAFIKLYILIILLKLTKKINNKIVNHHTF